jgi:hypothetical protein
MSSKSNNDTSNATGGETSADYMSLEVVNSSKIKAKSPVLI